MALARTMADLAFQTDVRDILKASDYVEHKVEFSHFLKTSTGLEFIARAASAIGVESGFLQDRLAGLPPLDFYVPMREKREKWLPGHLLAVGFASSEDDASVKSFLPTGETVTLHARTLLDSPLTLFVMHPAEPKGFRYGYQEPRMGETIQHHSEINIGGFTHEVGADGQLRRVEFADLPVGQRPMVRVRTTAGVAIENSTFNPSNSPMVAADVTPGSLINWDSPTSGDGVGDCEVYSRQEFYNSPGSSYIEKTRWPVSGNVGGLPCADTFWGFYIWDWYYENEYGIKVLSNGFGGVGQQFIRRKVIEDDSFSDDNWGVNQFGYPDWAPGECYYGNSDGSFYQLQPWWGHECTVGTADGGTEWNGMIWSDT